MSEFKEFTKVFFWDTTRMDNVNYNFNIAKTLCQKWNGKYYILKPVTLLLVSIIECILYDFLRRINEYPKEPIPGLDEKKIDDTKTKITDEFEPIISHIRKHNYLQQDPLSELYSNLDKLRKIRNRIHIQNRNNELDEDDIKIWTVANMQLAGTCLEQVCKALCLSYPRPGHGIISFINFPRPWF